jgi:transposase-like protein
MSTNGLPTNLLEAIRYFQDPDVANQFVASFRWPDGPECPACGGKELGYIKTRRLWQCRNKECKKQFSVKVGTIFEDSPIELDKWIAAVWLIANARNGVSSHEVGRSIGVTQKTAWFMMHRIRLAMQDGTFRKFSGEVEADETYIGGKARNMHPERRARAMGNRVAGFTGKTAVLGVIERDGEVRAEVVEETSKRWIDPKVRGYVEAGSAIFTDAHGAYSGLSDEYTHEVVDHAVTYVQGRVHTNTMENFWSLLKRGLHGTYISVQPFHLFRYIDEQVYRFNKRKARDYDRAAWLLGSVAGRRLTWDSLTGKG